MSFWDIVVSVLEVAAVVFTIWAVFHENKFIAFEEKIVCKFRRKRLRIAASKGEVQKIAG